MLPSGGVDIEKKRKITQSNFNLNFNGDIAPYDHNRLILNPKVSGSNYVDASFLKIKGNSYIVAPVIFLFNYQVMFHELILSDQFIHLFI